ncbi:MAG: hypothetical protein IMW91_07040 [Firmicutes bacterium]|nr:hypothetical protein [Bacillota bacterium]
MNEHAALWQLLQFSDSMFPTGAFSHSFGLESVVQEGRLTDGKQAQVWLIQVMTRQWAPADGLIGLLAEKALTSSHDALARIVRLDARLTASKTAQESRLAALSTGRHLLREAATVMPGGYTADYARYVLDSGGAGSTEVSEEERERRERLGNAVVVYALLGADCAWVPGQSTLAAAFAAAAGLVVALVKLVPLGQSEGQRLLAAIREPIEAALAEQEGHTEDDLESGALPAMEIAQMRHALLYSRLFRS